MRIAIAGGGICGLTLALTAKTAGLIPIVIEQRPQILTQSFGGGIGLWPPSQQVFENLGILDKLEAVSGVMPSASYFNHKGQLLGQPSRHFPSRYRIITLERVMLSKILYQQCLAKGVEIRTGVSISNAISSPNSVQVELSNGEQIQANSLIGADGINSTVRNIIMKDRNQPEVKPYHCGYAYFRAVVDLSKLKGYDPTSSKFHSYAFQSWGEEKRFGYVPLKQPFTFWFVAIPINSNNLTEFQGSHTCSEEQKKSILDLFQHWKAPIDIKNLLQQTPAKTILRTDIRKIQGVTSFPWNSENNKIVIIGDAANATAPNLAQGAGLAIQSAWDLVAMVNFKTGSGIKEFIEKRRKRAQTVQGMADLVAKIGQLDRPLSDIRDFVMFASTKLFNGLEQRVFESLVNYSLGGSSDSLFWLAPFNANSGFFEIPKRKSCLFSKVVGQKEFSKLPEKTQLFRQQLMGQGTGDVSVQSGLIGKLLGLAESMQNKKFGAYVDTSFNSKTQAIQQKWTRIFGMGENGAKKYSTFIRATPSFGSSQSSGLVLTQSMGTGFIRDLFRFGYNIKFVENTACYESIGLWLWNYKLPIPRMLLPTSCWVQHQTQEGWKFDGAIKYPKVLGGSTFFKYSGDFKPQMSISHQNKKVAIAGGSGFIGKEVARIFFKNGWHVTILSRSSKPISQLPFAKVQKWNPESSKDKLAQQIESLSEILKDIDVVINLAGQSPAGARWTDAKKERILKSRLASIDVLTEAVNKVGNKNLIFIQSSAIGIYGSRKDQILLQNSPASQDSTFRINCVKSLESLTKDKSPSAVLLRIGHVLGSQGGMLPFLKLFSLLRGKKYGAGGQFIPWVHVEDVGSAMLHIANKHALYRGKIVNMSSPEHHTYDTLYQEMGEMYNRTPFFRIPEWVFKMLLGELSSVLLESQRVHPQLLLDNGFKFQFSELKKALSSRALL